MKKIFAIMLIALTLAGCGSRTVDFFEVRNAVISGSTDPVYDVNHDGKVNFDDVEYARKLAEK